MIINVELNEQQAAVVLRCLSYGEHAISKEEHDNGIASVIEESVGQVRKSIVKQLSEGIIWQHAGSDDSPEQKPIRVKNPRRKTK